ncbi:MAG: type IV pilus secretin PilQ [Gammaproteobacteria bacterium]|nr:MAG: type IV pilus secretin PilQ [Gammaproteobacteria bacterium]
MSTARPAVVFRAPGASGVDGGLLGRALAAGAMAILTALAVLAGLVLATSGALAADAALQLQDVQVQTLPGNKVELELKLSGAAPEPLSFTIENPARIALDLPNTVIALQSRRKDVGIGNLATVLAAESGGRTRVVLNLDTMVPYQTRVAGNSVFVTLGTPGSGAATSTASAEAASAPAVAAPGGASATTPGAARSIQAVDFRRAENGGGRVILNLSEVGAPVDVRKEAGQIVLTLGNTQLPDSMVKRLDVTDFATPVDTVDVSRVGANARIVIAAHGNFDELAYQSDKVFTVEVKPVVKAAVEQKATLFSPDKQYSGEKLTLNFQDIETRAVLQLLADVSGRNIVVSDSVQGNVTLRLQSVPWDQALDIVLATKGLDKRQNGNVMIIAPAEEIAAREKADLEARKEIRQLEPLVSEYLQVNYAKADDLAKLIKGKSQNSLLSERGSVALDERTNTLLVQDTAERVTDIRRLVSTLDIPVRQVLIESRVVVVRDDFSRDLGVRWGVTAVDDHGSSLLSTTGSAAGNDTIVGSAISNINSTGNPYPVTTPTLNDRFNVNLPVANPAGRLAVALLNENFLVDLELSALQAEGRGEVISSPRVITANQKEAFIKQGVEIPYQESSSSGATSTQFKEAVLSLTVKPQITPDDRIIMDLRVTKDSVGKVITNERGGQVPSIDTRSVETQVLVNNGQTVVLGGIYETEQGEDMRKVPFLGDIPGLGYLFRSSTRVSKKSELLIFVTPKILKEGSSIY